MIKRVLSHQNRDFSGSTVVCDAIERRVSSEKSQHVALGVSIIVVNWNGGDLVQNCVQALVSQNVKPEQIIVVDNNSQDGSPDRIESQFKEVKVLRQRQNIGFAAANNRAIEYAGDAHWIGLVNPDAVPKPDWLERILEAAESNENFACFGSRLIADAEGRALDGVGDVYHVSGAHWRRGYRTAAPGRYLKRQEIFAPCAAAALYQTDAIKAVGGFDESLFCYSEDVDLGFRLRLIGHRCLYVPDAVVYHIGSAISGHASDFTIYHGHRNLIWVYAKDMPLPLFLLYLPQHLFLNLWLILRFIARGQGRTILRAKRDAILGLPDVWHRRRAVQMSRRISIWTLRRAMAHGVRSFLARRYEQIAHRP